MTTRRKATAKAEPTEQDEYRPAPYPVVADPDPAQVPGLEFNAPDEPCPPFAVA